MPHWDLTSLRPGTRVCIRIGHKWPDCADHVFAYFADCIDTRTGTVLCWNLTTGESMEAPIDTAGQYKGRPELKWTRPPSEQERGAGIDDVVLRLNARVRSIRRLPSPS